MSIDDIIETINNAPTVNSVKLIGCNVNLVTCDVSPAVIDAALVHIEQNGITAIKALHAGLSTDQANWLSRELNKDPRYEAAINKVWTAAYGAP